MRILECAVVAAVEMVAGAALAVIAFLAILSCL